MKFPQPKTEAQVLALAWDCEMDVLRYKLEIYWKWKILCSGPVQAENLESDVRIYDPMGLASPLHVRAKISWQELWKEGVHKDDELAPSVQQKWSAYFQEMKQLNGVKQSSPLTYVYLQMHPGMLSGHVPTLEVGNHQAKSTSNLSQRSHE